MNFVTVFRTFNPAEAQLVASRLEAAELPAMVTHETASLCLEGYAMAAGGILVEVPEELAASAKELLESVSPESA